MSGPARVSSPTVSEPTTLRDGSVTSKGAFLDIQREMHGARVQPQSLDEKILELTAEQQLEMQLIAEAMNTRLDAQRARAAHEAAVARLMQFRSEQQEAA